MRTSGSSECTPDESHRFEPEPKIPDSVRARTAAPDQLALHATDVEFDRATFAGVQLKRTEIRRCVLGELRGLALRGVEMEASDIAANAELFAEDLGIRVRGRSSNFDGELA